MAVQVLIGDLFGWVIAEVTAQVGPTSWQLNKVGRTSLLLSKTDIKANTDILKIGNRVLVRFDNGLPNWGGTIEVPWTETAADISVTCLGIENLLFYRNTKKNRAFYNTPVGAIFQAVILEAQTYQSLGISLGHIWSGGGDHSPRYHFRRVLDVLTESLCKMEACDFAFLPNLAAGRISFTGELYFQRGVDKSDSTVLLEGTNVSNPTMEWQGPLVNHFVAIGSGGTWDDTRPVSMQKDVQSILDYGLREDSEIYTGVIYSTTLDTHAATVVKNSARPSRKVSLGATNTAPGLFASYDVGDSVRLVLPSFDYDQAVRMVAREFNPASGGCALVVEEKTTVEPTYAGNGEEV